MYRFIEKLRMFMLGRYGFDELSGFLLIAIVPIAAVNMFFRNPYVYIVQWLLLILGVLRVISKNYTARQKENYAFLKVYRPIRSFIKLEARKIRERKYRVYKKCPACRANISLPRKSGKHTVRCPKCGNKFCVKIR